MTQEQELRVCSKLLSLGMRGTDILVAVHIHLAIQEAIAAVLAEDAEKTEQEHPNDGKNRIWYEGHDQ